MGKKREHKVVLSCDPSFKGCAFVLWDKANDNYSKSEVYDIRDGRKQYDLFLTQVKLVNDLLDTVFKDFDPHIQDCTAFIIEGQFKPKMQCLLHAIVNQLYIMIPKENDLKVFTISARTWRPFFTDLATGNYSQRKKASVAYVRANPQLICSELWTKDDNICEAILLLNYVVQKHALLIRDTMPIRLWLGDEHKDFEDKQIKKSCPDCKMDKYMSIRITGKGPKKGEPYFHCKQCQTQNNKGYKGAVTNKKWLDLIRAAQRQANNYLLDDEGGDTEEVEEEDLTAVDELTRAVVKAAARKKAALAKVKKPIVQLKTAMDYEFEIQNLKARVATLEGLLPVEPPPSQWMTGAKRRKMDDETPKYFSYEERWVNGDGDDDGDYDIPTTPTAG